MNDPSSILGRGTVLLSNLLITLTVCTSIFLLHTLRGGENMGYMWDISNGNDDNKVDISPITNRLCKSARIIIPALLVSSVALADDVPGKAGEAAKAVSKASKTKKKIELFKKGAGLAVTGQTCFKALEKGAENHKSGNPALDAMTVALAIACGYLIAFAQLSLDEG